MEFEIVEETTRRVKSAWWNVHYNMEIRDDTMGGDLTYSLSILPIGRGIHQFKRPLGVVIYSRDVTSLYIVANDLLSKFKPLPEHAGRGDLVGIMKETFRKYGWRKKDGDVWWLDRTIRERKKPKCKKSARALRRAKRKTMKS